MGGVLTYDGQSVLATWVAERLYALAPDQVTVRRCEDARAAFTTPLYWEDEEGGRGGVEAVLRASAAATESGRIALARYERSSAWRAIYGQGYRWAERNRTAALWIAQRCGRERPEYAVSSWLFLRLLGLTFLCAFLSLWVQVRGLFGSDGVLPLQAMVSRVPSPGAGFARAPSLLWFSASDGALTAWAVAGVALSVALVVGAVPRLTLAALVTLYLSFVTVGAPFLSFQWDTLLIETGFLAIFLAPAGLWRPLPAAEPWPLPRRLLKWLLFRLMFLSGMVKLTSGDPAWRHLTALDFHLWTQPLPSATAHWMAQWPGAALRLETALTLVIELVFPFLLFGNRPLRRIGVLGFLALLAGIALTGSYGFLGLLTAALCVLVIDDSDLRWLRVRANAAPPVVRRPPRLRRALARIVLLGVFVASLGATWARLRRTWEIWAPLRVAHEMAGPFLVANAYGMFEVMTTERLELSVEGSPDGVTWRPWTFRYKPGAPEARPRYAAPHMPRLDWMMWFAALGDCSQSPWLFALQYQLLRGSPAVQELFAAAPDVADVRFTRVTAAPYRFDLDGEGWWRVGDAAPFCPAVTLRDGRLVPAAPR